MVECRVAALTVVGHLDSFESRLREPGPTDPEFTAVEELGLHQCGEAFRDDVVGRPIDAAH